MEQGIAAAGSSTWKSFRRQAARIPTKVWIVLWLFLAAAVFMALHTALSDKSASLRLKVQHAFRSGQISVFVDGELAYSGKLTGSPKKKFGLIPDSVQGSLSQVVPLSSGKHVIRVQVISSDGSVQEDSTSSDFVRNSERILSVSARRGSVFATWQGDNSVVTEAASSSAWLGRYASTLFLTMAGSIISALTGFALRELPGQIRARRADATTTKAESVVTGR